MKITTKNRELQKEWNGYVEKNKDSYGRAVIEVIVKVCAELDNGRTPQEAEDKGIKDSGITGFQAGVMAGVIARFHPRGEEFRIFFNKQYGGTGEEKGTINPAIMTIKA